MPVRWALPCRVPPGLHPGSESVGKGQGLADANGREVAVSLAPSYTVLAKEPLRIVAALRKLGFCRVEETISVLEETIRSRIRHAEGIGRAALLIILPHGRSSDPTGLSPSPAAPPSPPLTHGGP
ncbi:MAG: hypothetical protein ACOX20_01055 [Limnochordia bacterium]